MKTKRTVVMDASFALSLLLPDEKSIVDVNNKFIAPNLLKLEVANGLRSAVISHRIDLNVAFELLKEFESWPISFQDVNLNQVLKIAVENKISGYDACYLFLAQSFKAELATFDRQL